MSTNVPRVKPVKLICGVLFNTAVDLPLVDSRLIHLFGPIESKSPVFPFTFTEYYNFEMGSGLSKQFYAFENLISPDSLADIKNRTIALESEFSINRRRSLNLDPGYLEESKLVLASTKNFSHRIYLRDDIWAEVTMRFVKSDFVFHPWTYADYSQKLATDYFKLVRLRYHAQLGEQNTQANL